MGRNVAFSMQGQLCAHLRHLVPALAISSPCLMIAVRHFQGQFQMYAIVQPCSQQHFTLPIKVNAVE